MSNFQVEVLESKLGMPTLQVEVDDKKLMLHSKYNPIQEAERFIDSLKERIENAEHILFYGVGLGYHVRYFCEQFPEKLVSAYEPITDIANLCLKLQSRTGFPKEKLVHFLTEDKENSLQENLQQLRELVHRKFIIITLPVYERLFSVTTEQFNQSFRDFLLMVGNDMATIAKFSRRWTVNALMNLPHTLKDPNFLLQKKQFFKGKPAIIVSAGPSLDEELENLSYIKENGLAYIFAVGSANMTLIKHNIYPDAVITYDPQQHNYRLFEEITSRGINSIPMIYGTTVGYETLTHYRGPKLYFVTSQDKITQKFHKEQLPIIYDAPSVALIAMQLLNVLDVSKIILVGQNFAFKQDKFYAEGIARYDAEKKAISDNSIQAKDIVTKFEVEDVHGGSVQTTSNFVQMKANMELYLQYVKMPVINTTNGGAAIKGTDYQSLKQLIAEELKNSVVMDDWYKTSESKISSIVNKTSIGEYRSDFDSFAQIFEELKVFLIEFKEGLYNLEMTQIQKKLEHVDNLFQQYHQNSFYQTSIEQIAQRSNEKLTAELKLVSRLDTSEEKAARVIEVYMNYLGNCQLIHKDIAKVVSNYTIPSIDELLDTKNYIATSGIFQYEGEWHKKMPFKVEMPPNLTDGEKIVWYEQKLLEDQIELPISFVEAAHKGSKIHFRFSGEKVVLYGKNQSKNTLKLRVQVDNKSTTITIKETTEEDLYDLFIRKEICAFTGLKNEMHNITIEILSDNPSFLFQAIGIEKAGRAYHIHEVEHVEDLEIGKRIRCHYKATHNTVGEFNYIGKETANYLPAEASAEPNGDFYFIMVDEVSGLKKLISDRNIQNFISWKTIKSGITNFKISKERFNLRLLIDSNKSDRDIKSEWNRYIVSTSDSIQWNYMDCSSWTLTEGREYKERRISRGGAFVGNYLLNEVNQEEVESQFRGFRPVVTQKKLYK
ncbi:motility associated factor glycosyltransferase family protein [Lysinibacillus sp. NPDC047702]|uniref:motility associated factor glycosyltransferase family protein n=1 Tax=unclassified Lysinibacillus TaxID=2636778 RepID=UPI003D017BB6